MTHTSKSSSLFLILIFAILGLLHLLLAVPAYRVPEKFMEVDSYQYLDLAQSLQATGRYQAVVFDGFDLIRPPGYPLFLAISGADQAVPLLQTLLLLLTAGLILSIGIEAGYKVVGVAGAILYLLNPNAAFWSLMFLSETLAGFWLMLSIWCMVRYWKTSDVAWAVVAGLAISAGALTRPILLPLALVLVLLLAWSDWKKYQDSFRAARAGAWMAVGVLALVLPWQMRNSIVHGYFTLSKVDESTFQNFIVAKTLAEVEGVTRDEAAAMIATSPSPWRTSLEVVRDHPFVFIKDQVRGIMRTVLGAEYATWAIKIGGQQVQNMGMLSALLDDRSLFLFLSAFIRQLQTPWFWAGLYALVYNGVLYGLGLAGVLKVFRGDRNGIPFRLTAVLIIGALFLLIAPLSAGESRFRAPADPLLGLLAGMAFLERGKRI
jgi:4-amino-4-deoxy-L-arabinose transferase-like glycosyltransferase